MICAAHRPAPLRCPTRDEILGSLLKLLPQGRAWQSREGGPRPPRVLHGFWLAVAAVLEFVNARFCALREEFFCATQTETRDLWMAEYGLPDACDPFPDLCVKVAALGGARCEYFNAIVARAGWSVTCIDATHGCGGHYGCADTRYGGTLGYGAQFAAQFTLLVNTHESPAYGGPALNPPVYGGQFRYGQPIACGQQIDALRCLMDRIAPAHVEITYQVY